MNAIDFAPDLSDPRPRLDLSGPLPTIDGVPVWPVYGTTTPAARWGIHSTGHVIDAQILVSKTADGVDPGALWDEFTELLDEWNNHRTNVSDLLRFPVTVPYGLPILGSYGYSQLLETPYCPAGYAALVATGGPNSPSNVIGFRQHPDRITKGCARSRERTRRPTRS